VKQVSLFESIHPVEEVPAIAPVEDGTFMVVLVHSRSFYAIDRTRFLSREAATARIREIFFQHLVPLRVVPSAQAGRESTKSTCEFHDPSSTTAVKWNEDKSCCTCVICGDEIYSHGPDGNALGKWVI
jgi:hypothetical protein